MLMPSWMSTSSRYGPIIARSVAPLGAEAEKALWAHEEDEHQGTEGEGVPVGRGEVAGPEHLEHAEHEPAEHGTGDVAQAAEHHDDQALDAHLDADEGMHGVVGDADEDSGRAGQRRADEEANDHGAVHVDTEQGGHAGVFGGGPGRPPPARAGEEEMPRG